MPLKRLAGCSSIEAAPKIPRRGDQLVIHDYGHSIDVIVCAGGREIARVTLDPKAAMAKGLDLIAAASLRVFRS